jgi:predicted nucleic acid-binding protein
VILRLTRAWLYVVPVFVVLDSTVFIADFELNAPPLAALLDLPYRGKARVVVPEVVVLETVGHWRRDAEQAATKFTSAARKLGQFGPELSAFNPETAADAYEKWLRQELTRRGVTIEEHPEVAHEVLVRAAIGRRKPFADGGRGYRDALVWHTVLSLASHDEVALVTNNSNDFADDKKELAAGLREDLRAAGIGTDRVVWYGLPRDLTKVLVDPLDAVMKNVEILLDSDAYFETLGDQIVEATELSLPRMYSGLTSPLSSIPDGAELINAAMLHRPSSIRVIDVWPPREGSTATEIELEAECDLDVDWEQEPDFTFDLEDPIERRFWSRTGSATVTAAVSVVAIVESDGAIHDVTGSIASVSY